MRETKFHDEVIPDLPVAVTTGADRGKQTVAEVALNTLTNYLNHVEDTEVDFPKVNL
ncbi:MAG: hypothetical protein OHK0029_00560 [Armatimonadaceae bacterium]